MDRTVMTTGLTFNDESRRSTVTNWTDVEGPPDISKRFYAYKLL